jgi:rhamnosyltransferase
MSTNPVISVGILTKNGGEDFRDVLDRVSMQEIDVPVEIVILDSGSTDRTLETAREHGARITEIPPNEFAFGDSRDQLFSLCEGEVIVTISQDAAPIGTRWLDHLTRPIRKGHADIVQGFENPRTKPFYWDMIGRFYFTRDWEPYFEEYGRSWLSTANFACSREAWEAAGFGPIPMCSDKLFQKRAAKAGLRTVYVRDAVVDHGHSYDTNSLFKRCANEGMALKLLGFEYKTLRAVRDLFRPEILKSCAGGIVRAQIRSAAELLFPVIRPIAIWYGNHFLKEYWR